MSKLARDTGLGRESLYKALAPGAKPRYDTIIKLVRALGIELHAQPVHPGYRNSKRQAETHLSDYGQLRGVFVEMLKTPG